MVSRVGATLHRKAPPRLAVVGCGAVADYGHLPSLRRIGWRPHALIDPRIEFAEKLARRHRVAQVAKDVSEVIGEIEAAVVAVPPRLHASVSLPLLESGIDVLVEKPFATHAADARAMVEAAARSGACLAVGHVRRFLFVNRWVKAAIDAGALGDVERVVVGDGSNFHSLPKNAGVEGSGWNAPSYWNADHSSCGEGVLLDRGPHILDTLIWWFGPVRTVDHADDSLGGMEADVRLRLQFECGTSAAVELSRVRALSNTALIEGSLGRIEVSLHRNEVLRAEPETLRRSKFDVRRGAACLDEGTWGAGGPGERMLSDWRAAIRSRRPPYATGASALPVVELIERCYASRRRDDAPWRTAAAREEPRGPASSRREAQSLRGKTVAVTGATGFIGGWLVESLVREGARVRAGVRRFHAAARLARLPPAEVELHRFEMGAPDAAAAAEALVAGCNAVFHLAIDLDSRAANLEAVRLLGAACVRHGARLVFTSSFTVYKPFPDGPLSESDRRRGAGPRPESANAACEREVMRMVEEDGLEATVLQPAIVYGPFAGSWTERQVGALLRGPLVLPSPGDGICNAVYVADLVRALLAAAVRDEAVGETFLISGADYPTWYEFHHRYARAVGHGDRIRLLPATDISRLSRRLRPAARLRREVLRRPRLKRVLSPIRHRGLARLRSLRRLFRRLAWRRDGSIASLIAEPGTGGSEAGQTLPSDRHLAEFTSGCRVKIDKARRLLGYEPAFSFTRGMDLTTDWIRWAHGHRCARGQRNEDAGPPGPR